MPHGILFRPDRVQCAEINGFLAVGQHDRSRIGGEKSGFRLTEQTDTLHDNVHFELNATDGDEDFLGPRRHSSPFHRSLQRIASIHMTGDGPGD